MMMSANSAILGTPQNKINPANDVMMKHVKFVIKNAPSVCRDMDQMIKVCVNYVKLGATIAII